MCNFIIESLKPEIFWTALAALGTFLAILVALFFPLYNEYKRIKKIKRLLDGEVSRNYIMANNISLTVKAPNGTIVNLDPIEASRAFTLELWKEYKYKLADDSPESFEKYSQVNEIIENMLNVLPRIPANHRQTIFNNNISSFTEKCIAEFNWEKTKSAIGG